MSRTMFVALAVSLGLVFSCSLGPGWPETGPREDPSVRDTASIDTTETTKPEVRVDTNLVGRWSVLAMPSDTLVLRKDGKGEWIVDLGFRVELDSFQWSATAGSIRLTYPDKTVENGTYRFFGKDSFNMSLPSLSTQLYLRLR